MFYELGMTEKAFEGWRGVWEERWEETRKGDYIIPLVSGMVGVGMEVCACEPNSKELRQEDVEFQSGIIVSFYLKKKKSEFI